MSAGPVGMRRIHGIVIGSMLGVGVGACGPTVLVPADDTSSGSTTSSSTPDSTSSGPLPPSSTGAGPSTTGGTVDDDGSDGAGPGGFVPNPDLPNGECDLFAQDCPAGFKCMPWANDGGSAWNATMCAPVAEDPAGPGEPCMVEGSATSGLDDCELGAMCWDVDPETGEGICRAMCTGDASNPFCEDPGTMCPISGDGAIVLCLPICDPLAQDCEDGQACYPVQTAFLCAPDASGDMGVLGDPCEFINVCDPGLMCLNSELVPDCMGDIGCCTPYCDLADASPPCLPEQECVPWFDEGDEAVGYDHVGVCSLPQ